MKPLEMTHVSLESGQGKIDAAPDARDAALLRHRYL